MSAHALEVESLHHAFGDEVVLREVSFDVPERSIVCILGPSGCGKTTLLKLIAGIYHINRGSGRIKINGQDQSGISTHRRNLGFVFQSHDSLFPHLNVFENVAFPFRRGGRQLATPWQQAVAEALVATEMDSFAKRSIVNLSGGQKQRIALARALVYQPALLLLDEPLSSLDRPRKNQLVELLLRLHEKYPTTFLYVTHDDREVLSIATHVAVLYEGELRQYGTTSEVVSKPVSRRVAEIVGGWNVLSGKVIPGSPPQMHLDSTTSFEWPFAVTAERQAEFAFPIVATRLSETRPSVSNNEVNIEVEVAAQHPQQGGWLYDCFLNGKKPGNLITCLADPSQKLGVGQSACISFQKDKLHELKN
jgi:ABC-type Fe3+/spermidine/putrescine transport system ATPase subunit